ncbi:RNA-directed DNA polymerase from mobile element jockey [Trichonephila clavipes]|nr:RNA-directed DNA polymerase from mobile element jockey [Trichonephila clavipes]
MTSNANWSDRTDISAPPSTTSTGLGASPSQANVGDDYIAEFSDMFREAINARNIYVAWARKLTNAKHSDPDVQTYHQEVKKAGTGQDCSSSEKQVCRTPPDEEPRGENAGSGFSSSSSLRLFPKGQRTASLSPKQLVRKVRSPRSSPPSSPSPLSTPSVEDARLKGSEEDMELSQPTLQEQVVVLEVIKTLCIPPFFVSPKGDWRQLVALAKLIAPSFQSQMSGRSLKVNVGDEVEHRDLSRWLEQSGVEFKSFMLKQDRPVKVVIRGLPSNTETEGIKTEIEAEGFKVAKISQMKNYRTKAPMPLFYLQIENGVDAPKIFDFTELFGTRIEVKPFETEGIKSISVGVVKGGFTLRSCATFRHAANCIIAGDFNSVHVHWHNTKSTRFGVLLYRLIRNLKGAKLVAPQTATHLQPRQRSGSIIDLAVFKHIPYNHSIRVLNDLSSDHYPVILEINLNTSIIKNPEQLSTNWNNFNFALNKKPIPSLDITSNKNIELAISKLNQNFSEAFVEASKPKFKNTPKILSPEVKSKIHQRTRLRKFWQRTRCPSIYSEFHTLNRSTAVTPIEKAEVIADSLQEQFEPNHVADREEFDQRIHEEVENFLITPHVQEIEPTTPTEKAMFTAVGI